MARITMRFVLVLLVVLLSDDKCVWFICSFVRQKTLVEKLVEGISRESARLGLGVVGELCFHDTHDGQEAGRYTCWSYSQHVLMMDASSEIDTHALVELGILFELG